MCKINGLISRWGVALGLLQNAHNALHARNAGVCEGAEVIVVANAHRRLHNECRDGIPWLFVCINSRQSCRNGRYAARVGGVDQSYALLFDEIHQRLLELITRRVAGRQRRDGHIAHIDLLPDIERYYFRHRHFGLRCRTLKIGLCDVVPRLAQIDTFDASSQSRRRVIVVAVRVGVEYRFGMRLGGYHLKVSGREVDEDLVVK